MTARLRGFDGHSLGRMRVAVVLFGLGTLLVIASCGSSESNSSAGRTSTPQPLPTLDPALVSEGQRVYAQYCASCHGADAEGAPTWQQPNEQGNLPPPPHDDSGHTWRHGDGELFEIIHDGWRDPFNRTQELTMPPFGDSLSDEEIQAVITYFKSLWSDEHRRIQHQESQDQPFPTPEEGGGS